MEAPEITDIRAEQLKEMPEDVKIRYICKIVILFDVLACFRLDKVVIAVQK
jgi:hypothetical protein